MTEQSGIAPLALPRDAVTQLRDVLDQLLRTCTCDHGPARHDADGSCQSCNCPAAGSCPHCGSGDAGPTPEAYEKLRQRAVRFQIRIDNARDWARHNLDGEQQAGLLGVLRGDDDHAYRDQVNAPLGERTIAALNERLVAGDMPQRKVAARVTAADEGSACCVCGGGPVVYRNYRDQPFCWPCADCQCAQNPCVRTGVNDPAVSKVAAERSDTTQRARLDAALKQILADANHHDLCATESKTTEGGISHSSIAAGLRIAARHILAAQEETPDA